MSLLTPPRVPEQTARQRTDLARSIQRQELNQALLENKIDLAIGIFYSRIPESAMGCSICNATSWSGRRAIRSRASAIRNELAKAIPWPTRFRCVLFVGVQEFPLYDARTLISTIGHIEAATLLILSGDCVGYLPKQCRPLGGPRRVGGTDALRPLPRHSSIDRRS